MAARGVRVAAQIPGSLFARVDAGAVRQILVNLLDNAVKYGPPGQQVVVGLASGPRSVLLFVEDQGPGIPPGDRERIWEKFVRLERGDQAHAGGAGIGLSVVRELASLHGATASVEASEGGGARLVVEFPPSPAAPSLERIPAEGVSRILLVEQRTWRSASATTWRSRATRSRSPETGTRGSIGPDSRGRTC